MSKISGYVPSTFTDAGTGETFEGGKSHLFEPGAHGNFKHAGLIAEEPKTAAAASAGAGDPTKTKP